MDVGFTVTVLMAAVISMSIITGSAYVLWRLNNQ